MQFKVTKRTPKLNPWITDSIIQSVERKQELRYSPVPRLNFATRFDTKLREKQYFAKAILFTMYVPTVGICTQICARTWAHYNEISHASAQFKTAFTEFWVKTKIFLRAEKYF